MASDNFTDKIPTFSDLVKYYGPYLGLIISLVIVILFLQYFWFKKLLQSKNKEIDRLVERDEQVQDRLMKIIDIKIEAKEKEQKN